MRVTGVPTSCTLCSMRSSRRSATLRTMGSGSLGASASVPQIQLMVLCAARSTVMSKLMAKMPMTRPSSSRMKTVEDFKILPVAVLVR